MTRIVLLLAVVSLAAGCAAEPESPLAPADPDTSAPPKPTVATPYDPFAETISLDQARFANVTLRVSLSTDPRGYLYSATLTNEGATNASIEPGANACRGDIGFGVLAEGGFDSTRGGVTLCAQESAGPTTLAPGASIMRTFEFFGTMRDGYGNAIEATPGEHLLLARAIVAGGPFGGVLQQSARVSWPPEGYEPPPARPSSR